MNAIVGYAMAVIGASLAIGLVGFGATTSTARQPEAAGRIFTVFILAAAFTEALALLGFVLALIG